MAAHKFKLIYTITDTPVSIYVLLLIGLAFFVLVYLITTKKRNFLALVNFFDSNSDFVKAMLFLAFVLMIFLTVGGSLLSKYLYNLNMFNSGSYNVVEGKVLNYHAMPSGGHDSERFDVNKTHFEFGDYDESTGGYNNAASHGGAIKPNLYVRIAYFDKGQGNVILKLEVEE